MEESLGPWFTRQETGPRWTRRESLGPWFTRWETGPRWTLPVAGVAIRLPRAWSAADQEPLAAAGACQPIFNNRSQLAAPYLCLITSASSSNG